MIIGLNRAAAALVFAAATCVTPSLVAAEETAPNAVGALLIAETDALTNVKEDKTLQVAGISVKPKAKPANLKARHAKTVLPSRKQLLKMPAASGNSEWACLTEALYFEARGESVEGIFAVAEVIVNRKKSRLFPNSVCAVISQGAHRRNACQFSYKCDGRAEVFHEPKAQKLVGNIARMVLDGTYKSLTKGAQFYHARSVQPSWSRKFSRTARIGQHYFYRKPS